MDIMALTRIEIDQPERPVEADDEPEAPAVEDEP